MNYRFQCRCGTLAGQISQPHLARRGVCYCKDCRAYAHHLGVMSSTHDSLGGAEFVATQVQHVSFTSGMDQLACLSLSDNGLLRWYARCCNTPICNIASNWRVPYVGMVATCLKADPLAFERAFPRVQMRVNTGSAKAAPPPLRWGTMVSLAGLVPRLMLGSLSGTYRQTPFFDEGGATTAVPVAVLSEAHRARAYSVG